jgi:hypothetical protein
MNKRAKKRLKETIQKEIAERTKDRKDHAFTSPSKKPPESRGYTPRPDKKRG